MPFQNILARTFRAAAVRREAPPVSGVYGLSNALEWIYVGETDNIQASLLGHLQDTGTSLMERLPTGFSFELCPPDRRLARQVRLVQELEPACNRRMRHRSEPAHTGDLSSMRERY